LSIRRTAHPKASLRQISNICSGDP
jgi:hypothetical protein